MSVYPLPHDVTEVLYPEGHEAAVHFPQAFPPEDPLVVSVYPLPHDVTEVLYPEGQGVTKAPSQILQGFPPEYPTVLIVCPFGHEVVEVADAPGHGDAIQDPLLQ